MDHQDWKQVILRNPNAPLRKEAEKKNVVKNEISRCLKHYNEKVVREQFVSLNTVRVISSYDSNITNFISMLSNPETALETKKLLRSLIGYQLGGFNLRSRKLIMDLTNFSRSKIEGYVDD